MYLDASILTFGSIYLRMASVDEIKGALAGWTKNEHNINAPLLHVMCIQTDLSKLMRYIYLQDDWNILQFACSIDDSDTLKYCLEHRADVNYQSLVCLTLASVSYVLMSEFRAASLRESPRCTF